MLIGEAARATGLSRDTIRYYEKQGLICPARTDSEWNNYKDYTPETVQRLHFIRQAKQFGFTLIQIRDLLALRDTNKADCKTVLQMANNKIREIDRKIQDLQKMRAMIRDNVREAKQSCKPHPENPNCAFLQLES